MKQHFKDRGWLFVGIIILYLLLLIGLEVVSPLSQDKIPDASEYSFEVKNASGTYIINEFGFTDGYLITEDWWVEEESFIVKDRGTHYTGVLMLDGNKIEVRKR